ncbi:hypothetical protein BCR44DRAFT_25458 [Catenaria anguillulae PL171]|uniref:Glycosyltransferase family 28 N-terminal domain-containing protein n=1 Tax=Catenaria anguillulae PL171 TaxID=765915 RepID=A0A1Y2HPI2_9FUNG|nr:hypothetical protein BCR44DRAFT_25458 [Catenaria anguillulae PL171]
MTMQQKRLLFTCIGTRGDVEPCLALASAIVGACPNRYDITIATHDEFKQLVFGNSAITQFLAIEPSLKSASESALGQRVRAATNSLLSMDLSAIRDFMQTQNDGWFASLRNASDSHGPFDIVFLGLLGCLSGFPAYIKSLPTDRQPRLCVLNTFPVVPTGEFTSPTSGLPVSLPFAWLNRVSWTVESWIKYESFDVPLMKRLCQHHGVPFWPEHGSIKSAIADVPHWAVFHVFSPALLPQPLDWPQQHSAIGFLSKDLLVPDQHLGDHLPADLQSFLTDAQAQQALVIYLNFGSMIPTAFTSDEHAAEVLQTMCNGLSQASTCLGRPLRFVVHTFWPPSANSQTDKPFLPDFGSLPSSFFVLAHSISHSLLLPQVDFSIQHGGVGTLQASILHGCIPIVFPCMVGVDQSFWAGVVEKRGLGVNGGWASRATSESVVSAVNKAIRGMDVFRKQCREVAESMRSKEDPVARIVEWMQQSQ